VELPGRQIADGTKLTLKITNTGRLHSYLNTEGANSTVGIYRLTGPQERFTPTQFVTALQGGETYSLRRTSGTEKKDLLIVWE
jgi:hypothetical protein